MRTTIAIDDDPLARAQRLTGINQRSALVQEALRALIERESERQSAALGESDPDAGPVPRR